MSRDVTLADILGAHNFVETAFGRLDVFGVDFADLLTLLAKYPAIQAEGTSMKIDAEVLLQVAPEAVPEIISMACGMPGRDGQRAAKRLSPVDQMKVINAAIEKTMPEGAGPLAEALTAEVSRTWSTLRGA